MAHANRQQIAKTAIELLQTLVDFGGALALIVQVGNDLQRSRFRAQPIRTLCRSTDGSNCLRRRLVDRSDAMRIGGILSHGVLLKWFARLRRLSLVSFRRDR